MFLAQQKHHFQSVLLRQVSVTRSAGICQFGGPIRTAGHLLSIKYRNKLTRPGFSPDFFVKMYFASCQGLTGDSPWTPWNQLWNALPFELIEVNLIHGSPQKVSLNCSAVQTYFTSNSRRSRRTLFCGVMENDLP